MIHSPALKRHLGHNRPLQLVVVASTAAFLAYCSIYGFRKPFTAASFDGRELAGIHYKILLVVAQVTGYALSKFIGIGVIAGLGVQHRARLLMGVALFAEIALLGFAVTPYPWNILWLFVNGLPLGMAWGLVFSYLEGRRTTDILASVLCVNFIISSGISKTTGRWLISSCHVQEEWMPFVAGLIFLPILAVCVWILEHIPPPSEEDKKSRSERVIMSKEEQKALFSRFAPGMILLTGIYLVLTVVRDVRDNFAVEIWSDLGFGGQPALLTTAEIPVALACLAGIGSMAGISRHYRALGIIHIMTIGGALVLAFSTYLFGAGVMSPLWWMITSGSGLFLPYLLFNGVLFDRLLATFKETGNVGFLMYIADSTGYLGSAAVLFWKNFGAEQQSWLEYYQTLCYGSSIIILLLGLASWFYLRRKYYSENR
jgi:MFS family permease